uniref:Uncharacterized protein n=1 Tax=Rhizophora mucronata TaxID=61149 RepID=A0A2P2P1D0_RHIMU
MLTKRECPRSISESCWHRFFSKIIISDSLHGAKSYQ